MWEGDLINPFPFIFLCTMKPNKSQIKVINAIKDTLSFWEGSNDINSPTHECDIDETLFAECEEVMNDGQRYRLSKLLIKELNIIRELND
jgi:hypothetical protein